MPKSQPLPRSQAREQTLFKDSTTRLEPWTHEHGSHQRQPDQVVVWTFGHVASTAMKAAVRSSIATRVDTSVQDVEFNTDTVVLNSFFSPTGEDLDGRTYGSILACVLGHYWSYGWVCVWWKVPYTLCVLERQMVMDNSYDYEEQNYLMMGVIACISASFAVHQR